jgi:hypothetical protein
MKMFDSLTPDDFAESPVWEYVSQPLFGQRVTVRPVVTDHLGSLTNCIVGTEITLHNGSKEFAILGNVSLSDRMSTEHFLTLSVFRGGKWFGLARYHDVDYASRGPRQLANFLRLTVEDVFPISYDLSPIVRVPSDSVRGVIPADQPNKLSESQLIQLALDD